MQVKNVSQQLTAAEAYRQIAQNIYNFCSPVGAHLLTRPLRFGDDKLSMSGSMLVWVNKTRYAKITIAIDTELSTGYVSDMNVHITSSASGRRADLFISKSTPDFINIVSSFIILVFDNSSDEMELEEIYEKVASRARLILKRQQRTTNAIDVFLNARTNNDSRIESKHEITVASINCVGPVFAYCTMICSRTKKGNFIIKSAEIAKIPYFQIYCTRMPSVNFITHALLIAWCFSVRR